MQKWCSNVHSMTPPHTFTAALSFKAWAQESHGLCRRKCCKGYLHLGCPTELQNQSFIWEVQRMLTGREGVFQRGSRPLRVCCPSCSHVDPWSLSCGALAAFLRVKFPSRTAFSCSEKKTRRSRNADIGVGSRPEHTKKSEKYGQGTQKNIYHRGSHTPLQTWIPGLGILISWMLVVCSLLQIAQVQCFLRVNIHHLNVTLGNK